MGSWLSKNGNAGGHKAAQPWPATAANETEIRGFYVGGNRGSR